MNPDAAVRLRYDRSFRDLYRRTPAVLHSVDQNGCLIEVSDRWLELLGYERDEVLGRKPQEFLTPEARRYAEEVALPRFWREGSARDVPYQFVRKDEQVVDVLLSSILLKDDFERPAWTVSVLLDVTERREAELARRASEERYRSMYIRTPAMMHSVDEEGRIVAVSDRWLEKMGYERTEVIGRLGKEFLTPGAHRAFDEMGLHLAPAGAGVDEVPYQFVTKSGEVLDVLLSAVTEEEEDGSSVRCLAVLTDVTARNRAEAELIRAEAHYRQLMETAPVGIATLDLQGRFTELNPAMARLFGLDPEDAMGVHFSDTVDPESLHVAGEFFRLLTQSEGPQIGTREIFVLARSGERRLLRVTATQCYSDDRLMGVQSVVQDITEERAREEQLRRAERMAGFGDLIGGVAHELNNPLTSILTFAEVMLKEVRSPEDKEALELISHEAQRAARIVTELRLLARKTHDRDRIRAEPVDLNQIASHGLKVQEYSLRTGGVEVVSELARELPRVAGDAGALEQVVLNLLVNAEQAMQGSSRTSVLRVRTRARGGWVELEVSDTGPGIPPEVIPRIFDPFFTTKPQGIGTGLGLSLVHNIISEHHGTISVESTVGQGTLFRIRLPSLSAPWNLTGRAQEPTVAKEGVERVGAQHPGRELRILVVDDEVAIRRSLTRYLERDGHRVTEACDGEEALRLIEGAKSPFDILFTDLRMPGMDGGALLEALDSRRDHRPPLVVLMTGDDRDPRLTTLLARGDVHFLPKPFDLGAIDGITSVPNMD